jgi:hypothetical protein
MKKASQFDYNDQGEGVKNREEIGRRQIHLKADEKRKTVRESDEKNIAANNNNFFSIFPSAH